MPFYEHDYLNTSNLRVDIKNRAVRGAGAVFASQTVGFLVTTLGFLFLARLLTPQDFGLVAMVYPLSQMLQNFGANGFTDAVIQAKHLSHQQLSSLFWANAGINLGLALIFVALAPAIAWFYGEPRLGPISVALAATIVLGGLCTQHSALLKRRLDFFKTAACEAVATSIGMTLAIVLALHEWSYWSLVARSITASIVIAAGAWLLCPWRPGAPVRGSGLRGFFVYAINVYATYLTSELRRNADRILLGKLHGSNSLGFYDRACNFANLLPSQILGPLTNVSLALFSRLTHEPEQYRKAYFKVIELLAFLSMPISGLLAMAGRDVIRLLLGSQWDEAGIIFSVMALSNGPMVIYSTHAWHHLALGTTGRFWRWSSLSLVLSVLCFALGVQFGPTGVAVAYTGLFYLLVGPGLWYAGKPIELSVWAMARAIWKFVAATILTSLACGLIFYRGGIFSESSVGGELAWKLAELGIIFVALYVLFVTALFRSSAPLRQLWNVLGELRATKKDRAPRSSADHESSQVRRIALFGHFGAGNIGNDATLLAALDNLRVALPEAEFTCVCSDPRVLQQRYDVAATPMDANTARSGRLFVEEGPRTAWTRRVFRRVSEEISVLINAAKVLSKTDVLIMAGTGMLSDHLTRLHIQIFKWTSLAKLYGCKVCFLSVGAGPLESRLGVLILKAALSFSDYRSFRDRHSAHVLQQAGIDVSGDPIIPDLAFSLHYRRVPARVASVARKPVIGIGLMGYDKNGNGHPGGPAYWRYIGEMANLVLWLLEHGYRIRVVIGDSAYDQDVNADLRSAVSGLGARWAEEAWIENPVHTIDQLLAELSEIDILIASRFHNLVFALMSAKTVISVGYDRKNDDLLASMGLASFCNDIDTFDFREIVRQVILAEATLMETATRVQRLCRENEELVARQYERIANLVRLKCVTGLRAYEIAGRIRG